MTTATKTTIDYAEATARRERNERLIMWATRIVVYVLLTAFAYIMLFPFLYMLFTSLKTASDVFRSPPRLLPYSAQTVDYQGEAYPLYEVQVDGQTYQMIDTGESTRFGFFSTQDQINPAEPRQSAVTLQVPLDTDAGVDTGGITVVETGQQQVIGGEEFDIYDVTVDGTTQQLLLAYRGGLNRFIVPTDPTIETFGNARNLPQVEYIDFQWGNYRSVLELRNLDRSLINTALVTILVTAGQITTSLLGGYAFSRMKFRGRDAVFLVYLGTVMIPFVVLIIPLYQLMVIIGWQDHLVSLILPWIFTAYGTFLMRQFFITIPKELEEAAQLDGLSRLGILMRVFVPLSGSAIATQAIITFLYAWNSFIWPLVIISEGNTPNHVVTLTLNQLRNAAQSEPNIMLTGAAVAILPPLVLFILAQRYFVEGIAGTGLK